MTIALVSHSLQHLACGPALARWASTALEAVEPTAAVCRAIQRYGNILRCGDKEWALHGRLIVVGAGKAGEPMTQAIRQIMGDQIGAGGVVVKDGHGAATRVGPLTLYRASHPTPDQRGVRAARHIQRLATSASTDDLVLVLLSGGASALLPAPAVGLTLADLQATTTLLLRRGAPIQAINTIRKHCETLKGGHLARHAMPAQVLALVISDVVGSPLDVIASGPTVPDPTTYADALQVLATYDIAAQVPERVLAHLHAGARGKRLETPKPDEPLWANVTTRVIARNEDAAMAAAAHARNDGWDVCYLATPFEGEATEVGRLLGQHLCDLAATVQRPTVLIAGGETTVTLNTTAPHAQGGRNQELALAAAQMIAGLPNVALLALATDGEDGASPAAGAVATGTTIQRAAALGWDLAATLAAHNTYPLWHALDDALMLGPTCTNVNDLVLGVIETRVP